MLERIAEVQGVGLLHQANGKPYTCHKATLIYADNGRGKSTLATIFRSVATANASLVNSCKTLDGTLTPKITLQFGSGHKVVFKNGAWSEQRKELLVFDSDFIGRNVHSGGAVNTDHRKNLLEFALGEAAVAAREAVDMATAQWKTATETVQNVIGQLSGHHQGLTLTQFEKLPQISDIDAKIADLQRRQTAASNIAAIQAKPVPKIVVEPSFNIDGLFEGLSLSLKDVHENAEKIVRQHIAKLGMKGAEVWLSQGQQFGNRSNCPFCDQDTTGNDLVLAYQTHFNAAYVDLKSRVAELQGMITAKAGDNIISDVVSSSVAVSIAHASAWAEHVPTQPISFDLSAASNALAAFRDFIGDLVRKKQQAPTEPIGNASDKLKASGLWEQVVIPVRATNAMIRVAEGLISRYKTQLSGDNVLNLQQQIQQLQATKRRYDPAVETLFAQLGLARGNVVAAERSKNMAREALDKIMTETLDKYQASINALLKNFGASFSIKGMSANFRGNAPRSEYGLQLRGKDVSLEGGPPSFETALSEGDKRTLAFAFFIACALEDPKLADRTVVIDDPMCSLDLNRKHHTRTVLTKIYSRAMQLVVLAHDPYFLRDFRDALRKDDKSAPVSIFKLAAVQHDYTDFAGIDIDIECESDYSRHHRMLKEYADGKRGDPRTVAKAIRPMLEGYLHRRFPGLIPKDLMFGNVVALIRDSIAPSPLSHAKSLVDELKEINDYAGLFHHNTNPDADTAVITATELKTYVNRALSVVHKGALP